jgi:cytochrome P450
VASIPKGAYFPFLGGAHQCIGNEFAMLEMQLAIARVLQEFEISALPGQTIRPKASLGLWPSGPVWLAINRLQRRGETTWAAV